MATPPFLKSNRVEDIRDALGQLHQAIAAIAGSTVSSSSASGSRSVGGGIVLQGAGTTKGEKGDRGPQGDPGANGVDGVDGASLDPVYGRSMDSVPVSTRSGDLICTSLGRLVTARSLDEVLLFDSQNELITE